MPAAGATLKTLTINQASNSVILGANVDVNTSLALTAGVLVSNGNTITLKGSGSTITGSTVFGTAYTSYVATCDNSNTPSSAGGLVIENIGTSGRTGDILFPVGPTKTCFRLWYILANLLYCKGTHSIWLTQVSKCQRLGMFTS